MRAICLVSLLGWVVGWVVGWAEVSASEETGWRASGREGAAAAAGKAPAVEAILGQLRARESSLRSIDCRFKIIETSPDHEACAKASYESARRLALVTGEKIPPYQPPREIVAKATSAMRFALNEQRRERFEYLSPDGRAPGVRVFNGRQWRGFSGRQGDIYDSQPLEVPGEYLGIGFTLRERGIPPPPHRLLSEALGYLNREWPLEVTADRPAEKTDDGSERWVGLRFRHGPDTEELKKANCMIQYTYWLDPKYDMAPVRLETTMVHLDQGQYRDANPGNLTVAEWREYQLREGAWIPLHYRFRGFVGVYFPRTGDEYPPGFDLNHPKHDDFRAESFAVHQKDVRIEEAKVNAELSPALFEMEFEQGTIVLDQSTGKAYQVGPAGRMIEVDAFGVALDASEMRAVGKSSWRVVLVALNALVALAMVAYLVWRRRRSRARS